MLNLHLTFAETFDRLSGIVERNPDRYGTRSGTPENGLGTGCSYIDRDENGVLRAVCIVGQFFADLGLLGLMVADWAPVEQFDATQYPETEMCETSGSFFSRLDDLGVTFDPLAQRLLMLAQQAQDNRSELLDYENSEPRAWREAWPLALDRLRKDEENRLDEETRVLVRNSEVFNVLGRKGTTAEDLD